MLIPKQAHGSHKITAYILATVGDVPDVPSNILEYEVICTEPDNNEAILTSVYEPTEASQGDLVSIPFMVYDPDQLEVSVDLIISSKVAGTQTEITELKTTRIADRGQQFWNTRNYPVGNTVFTISYTYDFNCFCGEKR